MKSFFAHLMMYTFPTCLAALIESSILAWRAEHGEPIKFCYEFIPITVIIFFFWSALSFGIAYLVGVVYQIGVTNSFNIKVHFRSWRLSLFLGSGFALYVMNFENLPNDLPRHFGWIIISVITGFVISKRGPNLKKAS